MIRVPGVWVEHELYVGSVGEVGQVEGEWHIRSVGVIVTRVDQGLYVLHWCLALKCTVQEYN